MKHFNRNDNNEELSPHGLFSFILLRSFFMLCYGRIFRNLKGDLIMTIIKMLIEGYVLITVGFWSFIGIAEAANIITKHPRISGTLAAKLALKKAIYHWKNFWNFWNETRN